MQTYDAKFKEYENHVDKVSYKQKIRPVLRTAIRKSQRILDFGCGPGYILYRLSKEYPSKEFYGVDLNKKAIMESQNRYGNGIHLMHGKIKGEFDLIFTIHVLHEIKGITISNQIKEFYKHLKCGGYVYVYDYRKVSKPVFRRYLERRGDKQNFEEEYKEHNKMSKHDYEKLFKKAGFKTIILKNHVDVKFFYAGQKVK